MDVIVLAVTIYAVAGYVFFWIIRTAVLSALRQHDSERRVDDMRRAPKP